MSQTAGPSGGSRGSATLTLGEGLSTRRHHQQQQHQEVLTLRLTPRHKKKVTWKEGTVDNEFMNKKSSKKCCIFHKDKPFDQDDSDDENGERHGRERDNSMSCDPGQGSGSNDNGSHYCVHQH